MSSKSVIHVCITVLMQVVNPPRVNIFLRLFSASIRLFSVFIFFTQNETKVKINKMIQWTGYNKRQGVLVFRPDAIIKKSAEHRALGGRCQLNIEHLVVGVS